MMQSRQTLLQLCGLIAVALTAFGAALGNGFVYDDHLQILDNPWLRDPRHLVDIFTHEVWGFTQYSASDYYRPLMHALNLLVYTLFGPDRFAFHAASLLLHVSCTLLFFQVCRRLITESTLMSDFASDELPFFAALLFAAFPANAEAVVWLGSSADLLYVLFCLAALYCYLLCSVPGAVRKQPLYFLVLVFYFSATLSKETAYLLPLLLVVVDAARGQFAAGALRGLLLNRYLPIVATAALALLLRFSVLGAIKPVTHSVTVDVPGLLGAFSWYLQHLFWPFRHNFYPELPNLVGAGLPAFLILFGVLGLGMALVIGLSRVRLLWIAFGLIVLPLLPALANSALGMPVAERYLYMPSLGFCLFLAWLLCRLLVSRRLRLVMLGLLLIIFTAAAFVRTVQFQNDLTIWGDTIAKSPRSVKAVSWYATALLARGRLDEGIACTREAIELGLKTGNSLYDLAIALQQSGRGHQIKTDFNRVLELHPDDAETYFEVGRTYYLLKEYDLAIVALERATELKNDYPLALIVLGRCLAIRGDAGRALPLFERAVKLDVKAYATLRDEMMALAQKVGE